MKRMLPILILLTICNVTYAQNKWFSLYTDSVSLLKDANEISALFISDIKKIKPDIPFDVKIVLHTTPYYIYYDNKTVNIPLWSQVLPQFKGYLNQTAGSEDDGKKVFGLFFNGFYLPHELAHGLQDIVEGGLKGSYKNEYFANTIAMLWWRKHGRESELKQFYDYAKKMRAKLSNPVPTGKTIDQFFTEKYREAMQNPLTYAYMQDAQFIQIYEDKTLPDFDTFIKKFVNKQ